MMKPDDSSYSTQSRWRSKQHNEIVSLRPVSLAVIETATAAEKADLVTAGTARGGFCYSLQRCRVLKQAPAPVCKLRMKKPVTSYFCTNCHFSKCDLLKQIFLSFNSSVCVCVGEGGFSEM